MSELLASIPSHREAIYVATDAIATDARHEELKLDGPVCSFVTDLRQLLSGSRVMLETKHQVRQVLPWKKGGVATLQGHNGDTKLAQGGVKVPRDVSSYNDWMVKAFLEREPGDTYPKNQFLPFPEAHRTGADHVSQDIETKFSFEYDWKRELVAPVMRAVERPDLTTVSEHIAAGSRPWRSLEEFLANRELFDSWRQKHRGQLKTLADWEAWQNYRAGTTASRAGVRRSRKGVVDQARRMVLRAWVRGLWGLPPLPYQEIAVHLTQAGYPTSLNDVKKAKQRGGDPQPRTISVDGPGVRGFIRAMLSICPSFEHRQLVEGAVDMDAIDLILHAAE